MKKTLLLLTLAWSLQSFAQRIKVEDAAIFLRNPESTIEDAKKAIDEAAEHPETKDDVKTWFLRTAIYDTIYRNPNFSKMDPDMVEKYAVACKKCVDLDTKKRYEYYCLNEAIINSAFASYNKGLEHYNKQEYAKALKFFNYVLDVIPYDKSKTLTKNNITDRSIILTMADVSIKANNKEEAKKHLQKLVDMDYQDHLIYVLMSNIYLEDKDTARAVQYIEMGRKKFPSDKDLINQELNIYLAQGKQDVLLNKLNETLERDAENLTLLYVRGNVYDNFASSAARRGRYAKDTANIVSKKGKAEKVPAVKTKYDNAAKRFYAEGDSLTKLSKDYMKRAEADYNKVIEINPEYLDAYYNLGALTNNKSTEVVEKMNSLPATNQAEYDKKFAALKKVQDSILHVALGHFTKALELAEGLPDQDDEKRAAKKETMRSILFSMQQVYANLGDEKNTVEMMKRRKEL